MTTTPAKHSHWFVTEVVSHVVLKSDTVLGFCIFNMLQINTRFHLPMDIPYELVILVNQSPGVNQYLISQYCIILAHITGPRPLMIQPQMVV